MLTPLIDAAFAERGAVSILDVGGRQAYWELFPKGYLESRRAKITLLNLPDELQGTTDSNLFQYVAGDGCSVAYDDNSFDIVHSNSVIEHVGGWDRIQLFASECNRLGRRVFVQTPNFWFFVEPHFLKPFIHWLPRPVRVSLFMMFDMGERGRACNLSEAITMVENEPLLLDRRTLALLFPDCEIARERILFMTKSLVARRA
jgi:hypothetical protein